MYVIKPPWSCYITTLTSEGPYPRRHAGVVPHLMLLPVSFLQDILEFQACIALFSIALHSAGQLPLLVAIAPSQQAIDGDDATECDEFQPKANCIATDIPWSIRRWIDLTR